jgi:hypothetical protein
MPNSGTFLLARSELRTRTALVLETIALRHQMAVLERGPNSSPVLPSFGSAALGHLRQYCVDVGSQ